MGTVLLFMSERESGTEAGAGDHILPIHIESMS